MCQRRPWAVRRVDGDGVPGLPDAAAVGLSEADAGQPTRPGTGPRGADRRRASASSARFGCPGSAAGDPLPLLRVPLLVEDRDAVALELRRRGINVFFVYAPPLDEYSGPEFCEPSPRPEAARWWAAHVLPVDPHDAERVLDLVRKGQIRLTPAAPPPASRDASCAVLRRGKCFWVALLTCGCLPSVHVLPVTQRGRTKLRVRGGQVAQPSSLRFRGRLT